MTDTERSFAAAMVAMQAELPRIGKSKTARVPTKSGGEYSYSYADLAVIVTKAKPIVTKHGFAFIALPTTNARGDFVLAYELLHVSGEKREGEYPIWQQGDRALTHQEKGSAITYGRRYCYCCTTGIITDGDDDDAQSASNRQRQQAQRPRGQREPLGEPPPRDPSELPRNRDGSISRSQATDEELAAAGVMTSQQQAEHTRLRKDAAEGSVNGVTRHTGPDPDDEWAAPPQPLRAPRAAMDPAQAIALHMERIGVTDRDERLGFTARLAGRDKLATTKDLTAAEGARVLKALSPIKNGDRGALVALLAKEAVDA